jgi:hypothetical protein
LKKVGRGSSHNLFSIWYFRNLHALGYLKSVTDFCFTDFWVNKSLSMMWAMNSLGFCDTPRKETGKIRNAPCQSYFRRPRCTLGKMIWEEDQATVIKTPPYPKTINTRLPVSNPIMWRFERENVPSTLFFLTLFWEFVMFFQLSTSFHYSAANQVNSRDWKIRLLGQKMIFYDFKDFLT